MRLSCVAMVLLACCVGLGAGAQEPAVEFGGDFRAGFIIRNATVGWEFTVSKPRMATHFMMWGSDEDERTGTHEVALWNAQGEQLALSTISANSTKMPTASGFGTWRTEPLTNPILLEPGINYVLGSDFPDQEGNRNVITGDIGSLIIPESQSVNYISYRFTGATPRTPTIEFPAARGGTFSGGFGPNLLLDPVPEPGTMGLLLPAMFVVSCRSRRCVREAA